LKYFKNCNTVRCFDVVTTGYIWIFQCIEAPLCLLIYCVYVYGAEFITVMFCDY